MMRSYVLALATNLFVFAIVFASAWALLRRSAWAPRPALVPVSFLIGWLLTPLLALLMSPLGSAASTWLDAFLLSVASLWALRRRPPAPPSSASK